MNTNSSDSENPKKKIYGNPEYSASDDIYSNEEEIPFNDKELSRKQDGKDERPLDEGLDVPGAGLDDADELIGEEDEENNYYSIGGDDHNDLDEEENE